MADAQRRTWLRLLLIVVSLSAGIAGQYWLSLRMPPLWSAGAWSLAAIAMVALYFIGRDAAELPSPSGELSANVELILVAGVLLLGTFFVCFRIGQIPAGLNHDAAWEGLYAIRILNGEPYTPYTPEAWGRETLTFYFRAASIWLMGPTMRAVQAPGLLAGILTLPLFYVWARVMFGARSALLATLFLGVSGWHLVFSRTGWRSDYQPVFMAMTCCFFLRGMERAKPMDFFLAGLGLALTLNIYNGARVFPLLFPLWLVLVILQSWHWRGFVRRYGVGLTFMALAFAIAIVPLVWFAIHDWETFQGRALALRGVTTFRDALKASLLLFHYRGNGDDFFIDDPALELPAAVLMVFGLLWCLLRWKDERAQFLLLALVINLLPGLVSKPNLNRDVGTMVFVYFFVALGALFFAQQLRRALGSAGKVVSVGFLLATAIAATVASYSQYLGPNRRPIWGFYPETTVLGRYLKTIVPSYSIWVGGANFPRDALTYLSYQGSGDPHPNYVWLDDVRTLRSARVAPQSGKGLAFVLANEGDGPILLRELAARFPNHTTENLHFPAEDEGHVFAIALLVPPEGAPAPVAAAPAPAAAAAAVAAGEPEANAAPAGQLTQPRGVAVSSDGSVWVSDFGHHRIQQFGRDGRPALQWGSLGSAAGQFKEPSGIAVAADGRVAVADTWNGRVQFFNSKGETEGQSAVPMYGPRGVAFAPDGGAYVSDTGNSRVVQLGKDGALVSILGNKGQEKGKFLGPVGIAVDGQGRIYVADNGNGRLQVFSKEHTQIASFPVEGWGDAVFSEPYLAIDGSGHIWVSVPTAHELRVYDLTGKLLRTVNPPEATPVPFDTPMGIAYDASTNEIVLADLPGRIARVKANQPGR